MSETQSSTAETIDSVVFEEIPDNVQVPGSYTEVQTIRAPGSVGAMPMRVLMIGQLSSGAAGQATLYKNVSAGQIRQLFGVGTALAQAALLFVNAAPTVVLDVVGVAPSNGAVAASGTVTFSGAPTAAGTEVLICNGVRIPVVLTTSMQPSDVAAAFASAWTATVQQATGCTAAANGAVLTVTASEKGQHTNDIDLRVSALGSDQVPGVTAVVVAMAGGAGAPDVSPAVKVVANTWYTGIVTCLNDQANLSTLAIEGTRRFGAMVKLDTKIYFGFRGTAGQALALVPNLNSKWLAFIALQNPKCAPWMLGAVLAAVCEPSLNADPARQLHTLTLAGLTGLGPDDVDLFPDSVRTSLLAGGVTTVNVAQDGTISLERVVTTYTTDPTTGALDSSWHDIMVPATVSRVRYDWNTFVRQSYPRAKLADDGSPLANVSGVVTPKTLKASWVARYGVYANTMGWLDDAATIAPQATFTKNPTVRGRVDSQLPIKVMDSLIVVANVLQLES